MTENEETGLDVIKTLSTDVQMESLASYLQLEICAAQLDFEIKILSTTISVDNKLCKPQATSDCNKDSDCPGGLVCDKKNCIVRFVKLQILTNHGFVES